MSLSLHIQPAEMPITLEFAKSQIRFELDIEDHLINLWIGAATRWSEKYTKRAWVKQVWRKRLDGFPASGGAVEIRRPPVISIDQVEFVDLDGEWQTLSPECYELDPQSECGWLVPAYGYVWPATRNQINAVRVTFSCGYGVAAMVPEDVKAALLLVVAHLHKNREATTEKALKEIPMGAMAFLSQYRVMRFV